jgi:hypothetical protein
MLVGVFSDTHDHLVAIDKALAAFEAEQVEAVVHAGDFIAPFALRAIVSRLKVPLLAVFGNNDGERRGLTRLLADLRDGPRRFELGGRTFCLVHDAAQLSADDESGVDIVVSGHTHAPSESRLGGGQFYLNPGECCGWLTGIGRAALLDTETLAVKNMVLLEQERPQS